MDFSNIFCPFVTMCNYLLCPGFSMKTSRICFIMQMVCSNNNMVCFAFKWYVLLSTDEPEVVDQAYTGLLCDRCGEIPTKIFSSNSASVIEQNNGIEQLCEKCIGFGIIGYSFNQGAKLLLANIEGCLCPFCKDGKRYSIAQYRDHIESCNKKLIRCHLCYQWMSRQEYRSTHSVSCRGICNYKFNIIGWVFCITKAINAGASPQDIPFFAFEKFKKMGTRRLSRNGCFDGNISFFPTCCVCQRIPKHILCCEPNGHSICSMCARKIIPQNPSFHHPYGVKHCPLCRAPQYDNFRFNRVLQRHNDESVVLKCPFCNNRFSWTELRHHYYSCDKHRMECVSCKERYVTKYSEWFGADHLAKCEVTKWVKQIVPSNVNTDFLLFFASVIRKISNETNHMDENTQYTDDPVI